MPSEVMMSALTLRGLDEHASKRLKEEARRRGVSVNALLRTLVSEGLGISRPVRRRRHHDLDALAGTWKAADAREFAAATSPLEQVDQELWR
jgi:hypothetical protein